MVRRILVAGHCMGSGWPQDLRVALLSWLLAARYPSVLLAGIGVHHRLLQVALVIVFLQILLREDRAAPASSWYQSLG